MPELPEVETSKRYIEQFLLNSKILNIQSRVSKLRWEIHPDLKFFFNNSIILKIDRIGKYILINTSNKNTLILHLGMSGYLIFLFLLINHFESECKLHRNILK